MCLGRTYHLGLQHRKQASLFINKPLYQTLFSRTGFLNLGTIDILGQIISCCQGLLCIVECLAPSLYSAHQMPVATSPRAVMTKNVCKHCQMSPGGHNHPIEDHCSRATQLLKRSILTPCPGDLLLHDKPPQNLVA